MDSEKKLQYLQNIYNQQHYFVDRHDSMAEKFINILLVEVTCLSVVYALIFNGNQESAPQWFHILPIGLFVFAFVASLVKLLFIVRPLSSKAKKYDDESLISKGNKVWVKKSSLYYQGIINQIDAALSNNKVPSECFLDQIDTQSATNDLIQQIFILAQYSNYKREKLEESIYYIIATTILGIISVLVLVLT